MKILVVCQHYWPETFQITDICEGLVRRGHQVTALVGLPNYPVGTVHPDYRFGKNRNQERNGVRIIRSFEIGRGHNPFTLALNYYSFAFSATRIATQLDESFDLVFVYQLSPVLMSIPGICYAKKHKVPLVLYCCDLWPESMKVILGNHLKMVFNYYKRLSQKIYAKANRLIVQSPAFLEYFKTVHGIAASKMEYVPHFATGVADANLQKPPHAGINFFVMGNIGRAQDILVILNAVRFMKATGPFTVHFVGDGACLHQSQDYVAKFHLQNRVVFHGKRPVEEMNAFYAVADAFILTLNGDTWVGTTIPSRLQGYMSAGRPIFAAINGGARYVIEDAQCGAAVPAGDFKSLAALLDEFIDKPQVYAQCGQNGKAYFNEHFSKETFLNSLERIFNDVRKEDNDVHK